MTSPSENSRVDRLENYLRSVQLRKGLQSYIDTFDALDDQDRHRIATYLGIDPSSSSSREKSNPARTAFHIKKIVKSMIQELRPSPICTLPDRALSLIREFAGESPTTIASVCKRFAQVQRTSYHQLLDTYVKDPRMACFIGDLTVESIQGMSPEDERANIKDIYDRICQGAEETGIVLPIQEKRYQKLASLDLGRIAEEIQKVKQRDLIIFFEHMLNELGKSVRQKQQAILSSISGDGAKVAAIREWMKGNPQLLAKMINLEITRASLRTIPPEVGLLTHLQYLNLIGNQLTKLPEEIGNLACLKSLYLSNNRINGLPFEFSKLVELQYLYLAHNHLTEFTREIGRLTKLEYVDLSHNELWDLPEKAVAKLVKLRHADLSYNQFIHAPQVNIPGSKQVRVDLSHNPIHE